MKKVLQLVTISSILFLGFACSRVDRGSRETNTNGIGTSVQVGDSVFAQVPDDVLAGAKTQPRASKPAQTLHVFIENSGSMNGYINTASDFQMAIGRAIQLMKHEYEEENIKTYYVNQNVKERQRPDGTDVYTFVKKMLDKREFTTSGTGITDNGTTSTDLNDIVKKVLGYVDEDNTAILISDFIYSLASNNGVTTSLLYDCQNLTMSAFLGATKALPQNTSLATNIIQLYSNFEGKYWHWERPTGNDFVRLNCLRPYYICVLGTDDNVKGFNHRINIEELRGYKNQFTISNKDVSQANYTVLDTKYKRGTYRHSRDSAIHTITNVAKSNRNEFELGIGIDLSDFSMSETDKLDVANYTIIKGNYKIISIEKIEMDKLPTPLDRELVRKNNCTHAIVLSCTGFPNDISISIKRNLPQWIKDASSTDDRNIRTDEQEQLKTFGVEYFVEGIADAYKHIAKDKNNFTTINVSVKR